MRVAELEPGMTFEGMGPIKGATVICTASHPIFPGFWLVVWKMHDGTMSFDALLPAQVLPSKWIGQTRQEMKNAWKKAIGLK